MGGGADEIGHVDDGAEVTGERAAVAGVVGNYLYYEHVKQKILEIRAIPAHQSINLVYQEVGGVHRWVIILGIVFSILLALLIAMFFSTMIAFMGEQMDKLMI